MTPVAPLSKRSRTAKKFRSGVPTRRVIDCTSTTSPPHIQRTVSMAMAKSKGPAKAVMAVAAEIVTIVGEMAGSGMWRPGAAE